MRWDEMTRKDRRDDTDTSETTKQQTTTRRGSKCEMIHMTPLYNVPTRKEDQTRCEMR